MLDIVALGGLIEWHLLVGAIVCLAVLLAQVLLPKLLNLTILQEPIVVESAVLGLLRPNRITKRGMHLSCSDLRRIRATRHFLPWLSLVDAKLNVLVFQQLLHQWVIPLISLETRILNITFLPQSAALTNSLISFD